MVDMGAPRNDVKAKAMYARYQAGLSLAEVADEFGITRQGVHKMFRLREWPLRPRPDPLPAVEFNGRRYTMRAVGYYGATGGDRGYLHRHVWEDQHGPIPAGYDVHHRDHDRTNNALVNLELIEKAEHTRRHAAEAA